LSASRKRTSLVGTETGTGITTIGTCNFWLGFEYEYEYEKRNGTSMRLTL